MTTDKLQNILVISSSLSSDSVSRRLAEYVYQRMKSKSDIVTFCDLRAYNLPQANGYGEASHYADPHVKTMHDMIDAADSLILAAPIYNYAAASSLKNLLELTGSAYEETLSGNAWRNKLVGFLFGAGLSGSYMAGLSFANSLMLDFSCLIYPKFIHAMRGDFEGEVPNTKVTDRLEGFVEGFYQLHKKIRS